MISAFKNVSKNIRETISLFRTDNTHIFYYLKYKNNENIIKNISAFLIQKTWNIYKYKQYYKNCRQSIIFVQRRIVNKNFLRVIRLRILNKNVCARKIQKKWREYYKKKSIAACTIQKNWKCHKEREEYLMKKRNAIIIQRNYRTYSENKKKKEEMKQKLINSTMIIQKYWRKYIILKKLKLLTNQIHAYAIISKSWRDYQKRKHYQKLNKSASQIQKLWKEYQNKKKIDYAQKIIAAEKIQKAWKNYIKNKNYSNDNNKKKINNALINNKDEIFPYNEKALTLPAIEINKFQTIYNVFDDVLNNKDEDLEVDNWLHDGINYNYDDKMNTYLNQSEMTIE
ncbi:hypothetical protein BCR36DRAFT_323610, partial [Piromyces finnis]